MTPGDSYKMFLDGRVEEQLTSFEHLRQSCLHQERGCSGALDVAVGVHSKDEEASWASGGRGKGREVVRWACKNFADL